MESAPFNPQAISQPPAGVETIVQDTPCRKCAYNLRGLDAGGRCPECGTPVGLSIHGDLLRYSSPQWLEMVAKGISFMLWGILVAFVVGMIGGVIGNFTHPVVAKIIGLLGSLVGMYGAWLFTEPDPSGLGEERYGTARKLIRTALLVSIAAHPIQIALSFGGWSKAGLIILSAFAVVAGIMGVIGEFAKFVYLEKLALRIPDHTLAARAVTIRWGYAISLGAVVVIGGLMGLIVAGSSFKASPGIMVPVGCFLAIAGIALLVFSIMALFLLYHVGQAIRAQRVFARQAWSGAVPAAE